MDGKQRRQKVKRKQPTSSKSKVTLDNNQQLGNDGGGGGSVGGGDQGKKKNDSNYDFHKKEDGATSPPRQKIAALDVERKGDRKNNAPKQKGRASNTASTSVISGGSNQPDASPRVNASGGSGSGGGKDSKKSKKRRRQEAAAMSLAVVPQATSKPSPTPALQTDPVPRRIDKKKGKRKSREGDIDDDSNSTNNNNNNNNHDNNNNKNTNANTNTNINKSGSSNAHGKRKVRGSGSNALSSGSSGGGGEACMEGGAGRPAAPRLSELQKRMRQKLEGAQFRMINETLYTSESGASLAKFKGEPELFDVYHRGFREQVEKWPVHPLDIIIEWLGKYPKARVADFGCGEARLASTVPNKVHSFDLISPNPRVTACDMAHVPLKDASVHVAVFCLSLMGTNLADFLREAHRVLVPGGLVKVAEVRSRFEGEEGGVERFLEVTKRLGFDCRQMDRTNRMFLLAEFKKSARKPEKGVDFEAKACIYKRR